MTVSTYKEKNFFYFNFYFILFCYGLAVMPRLWCWAKWSSCLHLPRSWDCRGAAVPSQRFLLLQLGFSVKIQFILLLGQCQAWDLRYAGSVCFSLLTGTVAHDVRWLISAVFCIVMHHFPCVFCDSLTYSRLIYQRLVFFWKGTVVFKGFITT